MPATYRFRFKPLPDADAALLSAIAERFPSLRGVPGVRPFDVKNVFNAYRRLDVYTQRFRSKGLALAFILSVFAEYHQRRTRGPAGLTWQALRSVEFDLVRACMLMDEEHRIALGDWVRDPWPKPPDATDEEDDS